MATNVTPEEIRHMRTLYIEGHNLMTIAVITGRSRSTVKRATKDLRQAKKNV